MKATVIWMMTLLVSMVMLMSCGSSRHAESEKSKVVQLKADTVWAVDSVMVHDSVHVAVMGDTVREYKERTVWRERMRLEVKMDTFVMTDTVVIERPPDANDDEKEWPVVPLILSSLAVMIYLYRFADKK